MDITDIPVINKVGVICSSDGLLELPFNDSVLNHLQTIHASALFTLAEAASGEALQHHFPELVGKVIPVLRDSQIRFRKPATTDVTAHPTITDEISERFKQQLERKGRALVEVGVEIRDRDNGTICIGNFSWFIQRLED